jgi:hypothetical protein
MAQSSFWNYFHFVRYSVSIADQADEDGETTFAMTVGRYNARLRFSARFLVTPCLVNWPPPMGL